jgi:hypothetical protein
MTPNNRMKDLSTSSSLRRALARRHPSAFLLAAQLVSLVLYVAFEGLDSGRALLGAFGVLILALAVWVVNRSPAINWIAWVLAIPAFVLSLLSALFSPSLLVWSSLLEAALHFYAAGSLIAYMMSDQRVTVDELFAAGATFTLIAWGFAYSHEVRVHAHAGFCHLSFRLKPPLLSLSDQATALLVLRKGLDFSRRRAIIGLSHWGSRRVRVWLAQPTRPAGELLGG